MLTATPWPTHPLIQDRLRSYLDGQTTLREFQDWLVPATWDIHLAGDPAAEWLAHQVSGLINEYGDGVWTREEFRGRLGKLVT